MLDVSDNLVVMTDLGIIVTQFYTDFRIWCVLPVAIWTELQLSWEKFF